MWNKPSQQSHVRSYTPKGGNMNINQQIQSLSRRGSQVQLQTSQQYNEPGPLLRRSGYNNLASMPSSTKSRGNNGLLPGSLIVAQQKANNWKPRLSVANEPSNIKSSYHFLNPQKFIRPQAKKSKPLMIMNVDIGEAQPKKVYIYENTDPYQKASEFLDQNELPDEMFETVAGLIKQNKDKVLAERAARRQDRDDDNISQYSRTPELVNVEDPNLNVARTHNQQMIDNLRYQSNQNINQHHVTPPRSNTPPPKINFRSSELSPNNPPFFNKNEYAKKYGSFTGKIQTDDLVIRPLEQEIPEERSRNEISRSPNRSASFGGLNPFKNSTSNLSRVSNNPRNLPRRNKLPDRQDRETSRSRSRSKYEVFMADSKGFLPPRQDSEGLKSESIQGENEPILRELSEASPNNIRPPQRVVNNIEAINKISSQYNELKKRSRSSSRKGIFDNNYSSGDKNGEDPFNNISGIRGTPDLRRDTRTGDYYKKFGDSDEDTLFIDHLSKHNSNNSNQSRVPNQLPAPLHRSRSNKQVPILENIRKDQYSTPKNQQASSGLPSSNQKFPRSRSHNILKKPRSPESKPILPVGHSQKPYQEYSNIPDHQRGQTSSKDRGGGMDNNLIQKIFDKIDYERKGQIRSYDVYLCDLTADRKNLIHKILTAADSSQHFCSFDFPFFKKVISESGQYETLRRLFLSHILQFFYHFIYWDKKWSC